MLATQEMAPKSPSSPAMAGKAAAMMVWSSAPRNIATPTPITIVRISTWDSWAVVPERDIMMLLRESRTFAGAYERNE